MFDENAFIARLEAADAQEFAEILRRPTKDEDRVLRAYLGEERYERQRDLTLRHSIRRAETREAEGNVVVIHGIMGSELSSFRGSDADHIWVKVARIVMGALDRLRLADDGSKELDDRFAVRATGILKRHYGDLLLSLGATWNVRAFWFDWRKDLKLAATELDAKLGEWFKPDDSVHLVAHSMGGLVARTFIRDYSDRWRSLQGKDGRGGRLVMLGTPNHGSFVIPQVIAGIESTAKKLALLDLHHSQRELQEIFNSFVGLYQMLPSPLVQKGRWKPFYDAGSYGQVQVSQRHLETAQAHHKSLVDVVDPKRMTYVAGANQPTLCGIPDVARIGEADAYDVTLDGDGRVPHELGLLHGVLTYYVVERHGDLTVNRKILEELDDLLRTGECALPTKPPPVEQRGLPEENGKVLTKRLTDEQDEEEARVHELASALGVREVDQEVPQTAYGGFKERELEELVLHGFLSSPEEVGRPGADVKPESARIQLALVHSRIEDVHRQDGVAPLGAIAVGHYVGVKPQESELALDRAITAALRSGVRVDAADGRGLVLTDYTERGIIRGELGQPFFLPDPRGGSEDGAGRRLIVLAGMGLPGRFGTPELTVLARELCWSLGRLGVRHLATVLIGGGTGNLTARRAVDAWLRGVRDALTGSTDDSSDKLARITFVEASARRIRKIQDAILAIKAELERREDPFEIEYEELSPATLDEFEAKERQQELKALSRLRARDSDEGDPPEEIPTRLTLSLDGDTYRFGAITHEASLPERSIPLDPKLVEQANDELAAEWQIKLQRERGQLLERLLVPVDLRPHLTGNTPLVMLLDSTTARIHWEMLAQSEWAAAGGRPGDGASPDDGTRAVEPVFLGTRRGLTRQLRTTFAPPPEPPPPPRRTLRVLIVADPAADAPLRGAEEEGVAVADLFESFNSVIESETESRIEVVRLFGPNAATRTVVLRHLVCHAYDVLHFAGHCVYEENNPAGQGWLFSKEPRELLSPNELNRIDRIPKFVFSNACESGVTPARSGDRAAGLAPSFAESFFARGVSNFVCTAWPVNDVAAREFAVTLYSRLLGIEPHPTRPGIFTKQEPWSPDVMHEAMRSARLQIMSTLDGAQTWGAYQHYGSPYFRLFESQNELPLPRPAAATRPSRKRRTPALRAPTKS